MIILGKLSGTLDVFCRFMHSFPFPFNSVACGETLSNVKPGAYDHIRDALYRRCSVLGMHYTGGALSWVNKISEISWRLLPLVVFFNIIFLLVSVFGNFTTCFYPVSVFANFTASFHAVSVFGNFTTCFYAVSVFGNFAASFNGVSVFGNFTTNFHAISYLVILLLVSTRFQYFVILLLVSTRFQYLLILLLINNLPKLK